MVKRGLKTIEMTEFSDKADGVIFIREIAYRGVGMTIGQRLKIVDGMGHSVVDHEVTATAESSILLGNEISVRDLLLAQIPDGSVTVLVIHR